MKINVS